MPPGTPGTSLSFSQTVVRNIVLTCQRYERGGGDYLFKKCVCVRLYEHEFVYTICLQRLEEAKQGILGTG